MKLAMVYQKGWGFYVDPIVAEMPQDVEVVRLTNNQNPRLFNPKYIWQALLIAVGLRRCHVDIAHIQYFFPFLGYFLLLMRVRLVITLHEIHPRNLKGGLYGMVSASVLWNLVFLAPLLLWKAKRLIVLTESLKSGKKTVIIPMGATNRRNELLVEQERTVLFFGNMWWSKGLDLLLESMLASDLEDIRLIIAGAGKLPSSWLALVDLCRGRFEVDFRNRFIEEDEMGRLYAEATVVALPYRSVSTSSVLTTAFAYGKPVVASRVGSFIDEVQDGKTGILVDEGGFAEGIGRLLADRPLRMQMKENIRECMESRSWKKIAELHLEAYRRALG